MDNDLHVIFGSGPLGQSVMRELVRRGKNVRITSRHPGLQGEGKLEVIAGDATDPQFCKQACKGAAVVYNCANAPYDKWPELLEPLFTNILEGAASADAGLIMVDNLYMYNSTAGPMTESTAIAPISRKGEIRARVAAKMLQAHKDGKARVLIARASDFFGPLVMMAAAGAQVFKPAIKGGRAQLIGDPEKLHTYSFIDDVGRALAVLGEHEDAYGEVWHVPSGETLKTREFVELIYDVAGHKAKMIKAPRWLFTVMGWFNPPMGEIKEMLYQFENDFVMDSSKFRNRFGDTSTPNWKAIELTVDWFRKNSN